MKSCETYLKSEVTDWDEVYLRLRMSALGADFPADRFLRTPVAVIRRALREVDDKEKGTMNMEALPVARLTHVLIQVAHGFSGSKRASPQIDMKTFLPFPDWRPASQQADGPSPGTKHVLAELAGKRMIPLHVLAGLMTPAEPQT